MEEKPQPTKQTKSKSYFWIIVLIIGVVLFSTNPDEIEFKEFLKKEFKSQTKNEDFLTQLIAGPTARLAGLTTIRNDYLVFSTYEISILGDKYTYIGILNHFTRID